MLKNKFYLSKFPLPLLAFASLAATNIQAVEPQPTDTDIPEIVVTAKGNKQLADVLPTAHVLTREEIKAAQVNDIPQLLDSVSGVSMRDSGGRGSVTSVFVRGTSNSQVIVLIDGVRVGSASLGAASLNTYPIEAIERVEIVKGPLSGIYGADAAGGVIQLFTKKSGTGLGSATAVIGSESLREYGVAFNGGNDRGSFYISANGEETDGIDHTSLVNDGNGDRDAFEETALSFGGKLNLGATTVASLSVLYSDGTVQFDNTFDFDPGVESDDTSYETDTKTLSTAFNLSSELSDNLLWNTTLGSNKDESNTAAFFSEFTTNRDSVGTELQIGLASAATLTVGVDYYDEELESNTEFPVTDRDNKGGYALLQSDFGNFGLVGSLRYDDNSAYGSDTNGSVAFSYEFATNTRAVLSYGTAFVAPSFNLLYFPFFGNADLLPEESESVELSVRGGTEQFDWRVSAYQTDIENLFGSDPATFLAANIGQSEIKGVEFELNTQVADWQLGINLDLLSAEDRDNGIELDDRAEQTLRLSASRNYGAWDLRADVKAEKGRFDSRGTELPSYGLLDLSARYQFSDKMSLAAKVDNVFDKDHTLNLIGFGERYRTAGRQAKLSFTLDY